MKKKNKKILLIILVITTLLNACCSKEDLIDVDFANFIFKDKVSGENLFYGTNNILNKDSIFISYNNANDFQRIVYNNNQIDSTIPIRFKLSTQVFIKFSNNDIDTFLITYKDISKKTSTGQCKLTATIIKSIKFNNDFLNTDNLQKAIIIKK